MVQITHKLNGPRVSDELHGCYYCYICMHNCNGTNVHTCAHPLYMGLASYLLLVVISVY